jgi:hypothetical protein
MTEELIFGLQFILVVLLGTYLMTSLATVLTLMSKYKNYKETYLLLNKYILVENSKNYIRLDSKDVNKKEVYYDKKDGTIKLNNSYIFNSSILYFDLYSLYWYYKLKRRFIKKGRSLSELREEKLNKLLR